MYAMYLKVFRTSFWRSCALVELSRVLNPWPDTYQVTKLPNRLLSAVKFHPQQAVLKVLKSCKIQWSQFGPEFHPHTHRLWCFDENFRFPKLVLVRVHVYGVKQVQNPLFLIPFPGRPGCFGQDSIPLRRKGYHSKKLMIFHRAGQGGSAIQPRDRFHPCAFLYC